MQIEHLSFDEIKEMWFSFLHKRKRNSYLGPHDQGYLTVNDREEIIEALINICQELAEESNCD